MSALILTYHAVEDGSGPLFVAPSLFAEHLDVVRASGASVLTLSDLAASVRAGDLPEPAVAITFDDGFASVARVAAPLLHERGLTATVFCVAGHLGGTNDWPTQPRRIPRRPLARADELAELARTGLEIGSHGFSHSPLVGDGEEFLHREVVDARAALEDAVGATVATFAYPYGAGPSPAASALVRRTYAAACTARPGRVGNDSDPFALPRLDAHYVRRPELLSRALRGEHGVYLSARLLAARARRKVGRDVTATRPRPSGADSASEHRAEVGS